MSQTVEASDALTKAFFQPTLVKLGAKQPFGGGGGLEAITFGMGREGLLSNALGLVRYDLRAFNARILSL